MELTKSNILRLLLIPEKFRPIIAQFVDEEIKPNYRELSPSPEPAPPPQTSPTPSPAPAPIQTPTISPSNITNSKLRDTSDSTGMNKKFVK